MNDQVDIRKATMAKSDQMNADDLLAGPITGAITNVRAGNKEQPVQIDLDCWHVPYKPCKSMIRVLAACWGDNAKDWHGRSMTLYNDPEVVYGGIKVGGIRISHLSHLETDMTISLTKTRGKKAPFVVRLLQSSAAPEKKPAAEPDMYPAEKFNENFPKWEALIQSGDKTAEQILAAVQKGGRLTVGQVDSIRAVTVNPKQADEAPEMEEGNPFEGE